MNNTQRIDIEYSSRKLWFEVWRFDNQTEFEAALYKSGVRSLPVNTASMTIGFRGASFGNECGRMFLLDKSIEAMAREASQMAFVAYHLINETITGWQNWEDYHSGLTGVITAAMYTKSKFY